VKSDQSCLYSHVIRFLLAFIFLLASSSLWAATTYLGTNGVRAKLMLSNSVSKPCTECHKPVVDGGSGPDFTTSYSTFSAYATAYYAGNKQTAVQQMITRTSLAPGSGGFMPDGMLVPASITQL